MSCENCKNECKTIEGSQTDLLEPVTVPLYAVEGQGYRQERTIRGMVVVFCVAMFLLSVMMLAFGYLAYNLHVQSMEKVEAINRYWIDFISEYEFEGEYIDYTQGGRGINIIGDSNGVTGYESETGYTDESDPEEGR